MKLQWFVFTELKVDASTATRHRFQDKNPLGGQLLQ